MPRGGKRAGAGRKPGAATERTRAIANRAAVEGITPLEVMLNAMRQYVAEGETEKAVAVARDAAPYCHARLASTTIKGDGSSVLNINVVTIESKQDAPQLIESTPINIEVVGGNGHQQDDPADNRYACASDW